MHYAVYLAEEGGTGFRVPINPEQIEIAHDSDHHTETVIKVGEVLIPRLPRLRRIRFSSFWPRQWYPFFSTQAAFHPDWYFDKIERWRKEKTVLQFIVDGPIRQNISVLIDSFTWKETVGYEGEPLYDISLIEYRHVAPKKVQIAKQAATPSSTPPPKRQAPPKPKTYTLKPGDTLWALAQRFYGDGRKYRLIQQANNISDAEIRRLKVGLTLVIPDA